MVTSSQKRVEAFKDVRVNAKPGPLVLGRFPTIIVSTSNQSFEELNCLQWEPPRAWVNPGETTVHVHSSDGLPGGFDVACDTESQARQIAMTLSTYINTAHARLFPR